MMGYLQNSLYLAVIITCLQVLTGSLAAYGFSKVRFPGRDVLFLAYIGTIAVPWQAYMVPQYIMMQNLGLTNSFNALILLQAFGAFGVFLMRQYYMTIPDELCEAARIDGLSEYGIWARVILPLSKPALASLALLTFVNTWNDYMGPFIYLTSNRLWTVQLGLRSFVGQFDAEYAMIMTGSVISVIPILIDLPHRPALLHPGHRHERDERMTTVAQDHRTAAPAAGPAIRGSKPSGASSASSTPSWPEMYCWPWPTHRWCSAWPWWPTPLPRGRSSWRSRSPFRRRSPALFAAFKALNDDGGAVKPVAAFLRGYTRSFRRDRPARRWQPSPCCCSSAWTWRSSSRCRAGARPAGAGDRRSSRRDGDRDRDGDRRRRTSARGRLKSLLKAALYLAVQRWYLSLAMLVLLGIIVSAAVLQPVLGIALAPAPLLFVIWSNASYAFHAALRTP